MTKSLNKYKIYIIYIPKDLDGLSILFFIFGLLLIVSNQTQNSVNLGWVLVIIGIVKQLIVWN